jgi:hypothetical protein
MTEKKTVTCARCGTPIECNPGADCWCAQLPFRPMPMDASGCLCRSCLETDGHAPREASARPRISDPRIDPWRNHPASSSSWSGRGEFVDGELRAVAPHEGEIDLP